METIQELEERMTDGGRQIRGKVLHLAIFIEKMMEHYIVNLFTTDRPDLYEELLITLVSPHGFRYKEKLFRFLLLKHDKQFAITNKQVLSKLASIVNNRNIFAHWPLDYSQKAKEDFQQRKLITFVKMQASIDKKTKEPIFAEWKTYSEDQINNEVIGPMKELEIVLRVLTKL